MLNPAGFTIRFQTLPRTAGQYQLNPRFTPVAFHSEILYESSQPVYWGVSPSSLGASFFTTCHELFSSSWASNSDGSK